MIRNPFGSLFTCTSKRWATNLGGGSTTNGRDSAGKRLGIKLGNGSKCKLGQIIVRQRGFQYYPGENVICIHSFDIYIDFIFACLVDWHWKRSYFLGQMRRCSQIHP